MHRRARLHCASTHFSRPSLDKQDHVGDDTARRACGTHLGKRRELDGVDERRARRHRAQLQLLRLCTPPCTM